MTYTSHLPRPPLDDYIDDIYHLDAPPPAARLRVFPMPTLHLMINLGSGFDVRVGDQARIVALSESWCTGMWDIYHDVRYPASNISLYGVHFKPGGAASFLRTPMSELRNQIVPLEAFWGVRASEIRERLATAPCVQSGLSLLEGLLLERFRKASKKLCLVQYAVSELARRQGSLSIRALSDQAGVSHNHLGLQFNDFVGLTPKELARIYRFTQVLSAIEPSRAVDWTRVANQTGYYDQSHFNKEFAAYTGLSPTNYLQQRSRLAAESPGYQHEPGNLPFTE
jgi:AraC-like DNA-binding protein